MPRLALCRRPILNALVGAIVVGLTVGVAPPVAASAANEATKALPDVSDETSGLLPRAEPSRRASRDGPVRWHQCTDDVAFSCAWLKVPRSYSSDNGKTVSLLLRRLNSTDAEPRRVLLTNPGGPGGTSLDALTPFVGSPLQSKFDIVSWDPRGVGLSRPALRVCPAQFSPAKLEPQVGDFEWSSWTRQAVEHNVRANRDCLRVNEKLRSLVSTNNVVADLNQIRKALQLRKIDYLGRSYGTTIGRLYAAKYPTRVRTLALDGVVDPKPTVLRVMKLRRAAARVSWPMIESLLGPEIVTGYRELSKRLRHEGSAESSRGTLWGSAINSGRYPLGIGLFRFSVCAGLAIENMPVPDVCFAEPSPMSESARESALSDLANASRFGVEASSQGVGQRTEGGQREASPALMMIDCGDQPRRIGRKRLKRYVDEDRRRGEQFGMFNLTYGSICAGTPTAANQIANTYSQKLKTPPLLINGTGDVATPIGGARAAHRAFVGSRLITVATPFHVLTELGNSCVDNRLLDYLVSKKLPRKNIRCPNVFP